MKIAVIGIGGVGGYTAGMLSRKYSDLTVVARGARGESIKENGLVLNSDFNGPSVTHPNVVSSVSELEPMDMIFVCVKNYSIDDVCKSLSGAIKKDTLIVPVMNGVDPGDRIRAYFPDTTIVDSVIYIVSYFKPDFSIVQEGKFARIRLGAADPDPAKAEPAKKVFDVLKAAELDVLACPDVRSEIWKKYILNCAYNVATARHRTTIGPLRDDPQHAKEYEALATEAYNVGVALGVNLKPKHLEYVIYRFYNEHAYDAGSSLQRDVEAGRMTEFETFSGYIVKTAEKLGIDVPVSKEYYEALKNSGIKY